MAQDFTLDEFFKQLKQARKSGVLDGMKAQVPGILEMFPEGEDPDLTLDRIRRMIDAMTEQERSHPEVIDNESQSRIAANSATEPHQVEMFLAQFEQVRAFLLRMAKMSRWQRVQMVMGMIMGFGSILEEEEGVDPGAGRIPGRAKSHKIPSGHPLAILSYILFGIGILLVPCTFLVGEDLAPMFLFVGIGLILFSFLVARSAGWLWNNSQPLSSIRVKVVGTWTTTGVLPPTTHYARFETDSGEFLDFKLRRARSKQFLQGDAGRLTHQGSRFREFRKD